MEGGNSNGGEGDRKSKDRGGDGSSLQHRSGGCSCRHIFARLFDFDVAVVRVADKSRCRIPRFPCRIVDKQIRYGLVDPLVRHLLVLGAEANANGCPGHSGTTAAFRQVDFSGDRVDAVFPQQTLQAEGSVGGERERREGDRQDSGGAAHINGRVESELSVCEELFMLSARLPVGESRILIRPGKYDPESCPRHG